MKHVVPALAVVILLPLVMGLDLESFRAMYDQPWNKPSDRFWSYAVLSELGFDAVYAPADAVGDLDGSLARWINGSLEAWQNGLAYICGPFYMVGRPSSDYERAVDTGGRQDSNYPSPVDDRYWTEVMENVALAIANLSLYYPIAGIVWDTEPYRADLWEYGFYSYDSMSICAFANQTNRTIPDLPASQRHGWLGSQGLLDEFQKWQEDAAYVLARRTRDRVRAINPLLHLGTLGFEDDCWFHLSILRGFSADDQPVTAWHEDTYWGGYKTNKIDYNHEVFAQKGINGKVIPGLWTYELRPFSLFQNMEFAMRYNGTFWIYQSGGSPWVLGTQEEFRKAFELLQEHVLFNGAATPGAVTSFTIYPGIVVRPSIGPTSASAVLLPSTAEISAEDLGLSDEVAGSSYVGANMTPVILRSGHLSIDDLPCFLYGLDLQDVFALQAWSRIQELGDLLSLWDPLNLAPLPEAHDALGRALADFEGGRIADCNASAEVALLDAYGSVMDVLWPLVEQGFANPRNSTIPIKILNRVNLAQTNIEAGNVMEGRRYLLSALGEWGEIPESGSVRVGLALLLLLLAGRVLPRGNAGRPSGFAVGGPGDPCTATRSRTRSRE